MTEEEKLSEKAKEIRRAYKREWNRKNKDKVRASQARYWNKRAAQEAEQSLKKEDK